jgi:hypothetical protein
VQHIRNWRNQLKMIQLWAIHARGHTYACAPSYGTNRFQPAEEMSTDGTNDHALTATKTEQAWMACRTSQHGDRPRTYVHMDRMTTWIACCICTTLGVTIPRTRNAYWNTVLPLHDNVCTLTQKSSRQHFLTTTRGQTNTRLCLHSNSYARWRHHWCVSVDVLEF